MVVTNLKFPGWKDKVLTLSYDDGVVQDIRLIGILDKYGLKGTFHVNSGLWLEEDAQRDRFYGRMKLSEAKELYIGSGHEVAVHTLTHAFLERLSAPEAVSQVMEDRKNLERDFGPLVRGMSYPYGTYSDNVVNILKQCGICYSRTVEATHSFAFPPKEWLTLPTTCHHNDKRLMELAETFVNQKLTHQRLSMFYLWGHSYEFDDNDNWDVIERFAEYMGGREEIWYATNMEIYGYTKAYQSLIKSADGTAIYNPTDQTIWFVAGHDQVNVKQYQIGPGETMFIQ